MYGAWAASNDAKPAVGKLFLSSEQVLFRNTVEQIYNASHDLGVRGLRCMRAKRQYVACVRGERAYCPRVGCVRGAGWLGWEES